MTYEWLYEVNEMKNKGVRKMNVFTHENITIPSEIEFARKALAKEPSLLEIYEIAVREHLCTPVAMKAKFASERKYQNFSWIPFEVLDTEFGLINSAVKRYRLHIWKAEQEKWRKDHADSLRFNDGISNRRILEAYSDYIGSYFRPYEDSYNYMRF